MSAYPFLDNPVIEITSQPAPFYRFRYKTDTRKTNLFAESENNQDHSSDDENSDDNSTHSASRQNTRNPPKIRIRNLSAPGLLVVCCVNADPPHYVHPNTIEGEGCENGVLKIPVDKDTRFLELKGIRIQLIKRNEIQERYAKIKEIGIDPYMNQIGSDKEKEVELGRLRLCFQIYFPDEGKYNLNFSVCEPVVSNIITSSKQMDSIIIQNYTSLTCKANGGCDLAMFVKRLEKNQKPLFAKFYDNQGWEENVEIVRIHYRCAMMIKVPPYKDSNINNEVEVCLKLYVPKNNMRKSYDSEELRFTYLPMNNDTLRGLKRSISDVNNNFCALDLKDTSKITKN